MEIYTDGSCNPNPGKGGWAFVILDSDGLPKIQCSGSEVNVTNNRMELMAIKKALIFAKDNLESSDIEIKTDSKYCIGICSGEWRIRSNKTLVKEIINLIATLAKDEILVTLSFVKGHSGDIGNDFADFYANQEVVGRT